MRIAGTPQFRPMEMKLVDDAIDYMQENYMKPISADELSERFLINIKKLQIGVKKKTGQTIHNFQKTIRLEKAKQLLADRDLTIKEIAFGLGYKRPSHFDEIFKEHIGITPSQFRLQLTG